MMSCIVVGRGVLAVGRGQCFDLSGVNLLAQDVSKTSHDLLPFDAGPQIGTGDLNSYQIGLAQRN